MFASQDAIGELAIRIERAYRRRYPHWNSVGLTSGAWEAAAARLLEAAEVEPTTPIDPEFYVAVQSGSRASRDPWAELAQERSLGLYLRTLDRIVGHLREELIREVRRAEGRLLRGTTLDRLVESGPSKISPLALYILAHRAGRHDLTMRLGHEAAAQHRSCPLYLQASRSLLPAEAYPSESRGVPAEKRHHAFSVN